MLSAGVADSRTKPAQAMMSMQRNRQGMGVGWGGKAGATTGVTKPQTSKLPEGDVGERAEQAERTLGEVANEQCKSSDSGGVTSLSQNSCKSSTSRYTVKTLCHDEGTRGLLRNRSGGKAVSEESGPQHQRKPKSERGNFKKELSAWNGKPGH